MPGIVAEKFVQDSGVHPVQRVLGSGTEFRNRTERDFESGGGRIKVVDRMDVAPVGGVERLRPGITTEVIGRIVVVAPVVIQQQFEQRTGGIHFENIVR